MKLLTPASYQTKLRKTESNQPQYSVWSLSLSPDDEAGTGKTNCPQSTEGCRSACVGGSNSGLARVWRTIMEARVRKTLYLQQDRAGFLRQLAAEISLAQCQAEQEGRQIVVRLNAFSDIPWEHKAYGEVPQQFEQVVFYDYTKILSRVGKTPDNYALCASWSGENVEGCIDLLERGFNVAVAFAEPGSYAGNAALRQAIPSRWRLPGSSKIWTCFDGDESDLRAFDPGPTRAGNGRICALRLKSGSTVERDRAIASGFVQVIQ